MESAGTPDAFKLVVLGESRVGKTSITLRYCTNDFSEEQKSSTNASYFDKKLTADDTDVNLCIWDTAGQEEYHALNSVYYRDAVGAILVYDITDQDSFDKVRTWVEELRLYLPRDTPIAIAGNKCDMASNRQVDHDEAIAYSKSMKGAHFDTSAKTGQGIEELFVELSKAILRKERRGKKGKKKKKKEANDLSKTHEVDLGMRDGGYGGIRLSVAKPKKGGGGSSKEKSGGCCKSSN